MLSTNPNKIKAICYPKSWKEKLIVKSKILKIIWHWHDFILDNSNHGSITSVNNESYGQESNEASFERHENGSNAGG